MKLIERILDALRAGDSRRVMHSSNFKKVNLSCGTNHSNSSEGFDNKIIKNYDLMY